MGVLKDLQKLADEDADAIMEALDRLNLHLPPSQERAMLKHLYELHKLRDMQTWVDLSDKVYSDYYAAEAALDAWRDLDHA